MFIRWRIYSMWQWLSIPIILLCSLCLGAPTSSGPISDEEATTLWQEGEAALSSSRFEDAVNSFQRYVDRYPGSPNYLKAHVFLGGALMDLGKPGQDIPLITNYLTSTSNNTDSARRRLSIGHAYFELKKLKEAYLTSLKIHKWHSHTPLSSEIVLE